MAPRREWNAEEADRIIARHRALPGAMLPILHALQEEFGYIDPAVVPALAEALNLSRAEVHGVIGFYHDFRTAPAGRHVLRLCRAEACQSMGAEALIEHLRRRHDLALGSTTPSGSLTVDAVYCLGNCALSPAAMLDGALLGRVDAAKLDRIVEGAGERR
jgi:formate dehydrogenase subunit gamma